VSDGYTLVVGASPVAGENGFYRDVLARAAHVVAADAAGEWCVALGRTPDVVVGDFDGSRPGAPGRLTALGAVVEEHPPAKDATDLDLAVVAALGSYPDRVLVTAAFTQRIDHTFAAFGTLVRAGHAAVAIDPGWHARVCRTSEPVALTLPADTVVSVLSLQEGARITISGAAWSGDRARFGLLAGLGVSNRAIGGPLRVCVEDGIAIVIVWDGDASGLY
jgi:thiamine pyrophosphokinase